MVIFTGYSPSSQLNIKHMYALAFSRTCDTVFFTCSSLNHDKFMFKVPFWNHTSGGACPKTPYIQGNQDKRFSVSAFSYTHRFKNLFIYGINSKKFARFFTSIRAEADNRHNFFVISFFNNRMGSKRLWNEDSLAATDGWVWQVGVLGVPWYACPIKKSPRSRRSRTARSVASLSSISNRHSPVQIKISLK